MKTVIRQLSIVVFLSTICTAEALAQIDNKQIEKDVNQILEDFLWNQFKSDTRRNVDSLYYLIKDDEWLIDFFKKNKHNHFVVTDKSEKDNKRFFNDKRVTYYLEQLKNRDSIKIHIDALRELRITNVPQDQVRKRKIPQNTSLLSISVPVFTKDRQFAVFRGSVPGIGSLVVYKKHENSKSWYLYASLFIP